MLTGKMDGSSSQSASFLAHLQDGRHQLVQDHLISVAQLARTYSGKVGAGVAGATWCHNRVITRLWKYSCAFQHSFRCTTEDMEQLTTLRADKVGVPPLEFVYSATGDPRVHVHTISRVF
jgi:hypothetical protein